MAETYLCKNCGHQGVQKKIVKGSFAVEVALWVLLIVPGIAYTVWRTASQYKGCPVCGAPYMVPLGKGESGKDFPWTKVNPLEVQAPARRGPPAFR